MEVFSCKVCTKCTYVRKYDRILVWHISECLYLGYSPLGDLDFTDEELLRIVGLLRDSVSYTSFCNHLKGE